MKYIHMKATSLSDFDDKRHILHDGINTLPNGHKDIPINE